MLPIEQEQEQRASFGQRLKGGIKDALGNLKEPEGFATAALGAFLFGGPVGLALGIGQGIIARRERQSLLDDAAQEREMLQAFDDQFQESLRQAQGLGATDLDREQLAQVGRDYQMLRRLAMSPDPSVRQQAQAKLVDMSPRIGDWLEDMEGRNEAVLDRQVGALDEAAVNARGNYEAGLERAQGIASVAEQMHNLLADDSFDVNNPVARARLGQLLEQTPREFLADPADMSDALEKVGANVPGIIGGLVQYYAGKKKAEEFTFSKEDWRKVAYALQLSGQKQANQVMQDAERVGTILDNTAQQLGAQPGLSYLQRIITGKVQDAEEISGERGYYNELDAKARAADAAAAEQKKVADATRPSRASAIVEKAKETAAGVLTSPYLDPTGFWGAVMNRKKREKRRPTN